MSSQFHKQPGRAYLDTNKEMLNSPGRWQGLIAVCAATWIITAINPYDFQAWALEQIATLMAIGLILWASQYVNFSAGALYGMASLFVLHAIGTHFTYSLTPYDEFLQNWLHISVNELFGWQRNHYDRFVHFAFGLAAARPFYEFLRAYFYTTPGASWFLSVHLITSASAIYELLEWFAALVFSTEAGTLYLGSQGDIWDAQWDIALAIVGFGVIYLSHWLRKQLMANSDKTKETSK